jgi:acetyl coenzyme A synthetase (ADP forming)-like protein
MSLAPLLSPGVVAVIGAGHTRGGIGAEILHNIVAGGFTGTVVPVNRAGGIIEGLRAYRSVCDVPMHVELAVVAVPCDSVEPVIDDCIQAGVESLLVISAGFSETGQEGRARQEAIVAKVRAAGMRMVGPNCMGLINTDPLVRLNATFAPTVPSEGRLGLSTQSGALGLAILDYARRLNIGFSTFVSIGNKADVSGNDLIEYWRDDPRTDAVLLYVESFGNPAKFRALATEVGRTKPIIAVKAGRSRSGARAAQSHTGALASSDAVVEAMLRQCGVIRTGTLEELFDVANLVAHQPMPLGRRVAILTNAGGPGIMAADACEAHGLEVPPLTDRTIDVLRAFLPAAASVKNPVDLLASAPAEHYRRAIPLLLADEQVDSLIVIFIPPLVTEADAVARAIVDAVPAGAGKPLLASFISAQGMPPALNRIPCYVFPEAAALALSHVVEHAAWRRKASGQIPALDRVDAAAAQAAMRQAQVSDDGWLAPADVDRVLDAVGIARVVTAYAATAEEASRQAAAIGYPVVLKAAGPSIVHKTECGGVVLGIVNAGELEEACRKMKGRLGDRLTGFIVQAMAGGGVEMLVGVSRDPTFGHVIACATGGTMAELFADMSLRLPPLTDVDARDMVDELRGAKLLRGFRGSPALDEDALRETLLRVSVLVELCPEIAELDINPLRVLPSGVCALDARIRVTPRHKNR